MNKLAKAGTFFALALLPVTSFAHEVRLYEIGGVEYEIIMGSLGEPVIVDDKTGVDLEIVRDGELLVGAQESLQVELIAGEVKRIVSLSPVHGSEGKYKSPFIATVPTTLSYRLFGELEKTPIDITFTCNPAGHPQSEEDTTEREISDGVVQTKKSGAFGCPQEKEAFGFPESVESDVVLRESIAISQAADTKNSKNMSIAALLLALAASGISLAAYIKKK